MDNANEQAFPYYDSQGSISGIGLTKREYFAGLAMQGLLANRAITNDVSKTIKGGRLNTEFGKTVIAEAAVQAADELLKLLTT